MAVPRKKLASGLVAFCVAAHGVTAATNWVSMGATPTGVLSFDSSTIQTIDGNVQFWILTKFFKPVELAIVGKKPLSYTSSKVQYTVNCLRRMLTTQYVLYYNAAGEVVYSANVNDWAPIAPETLGESFHQTFCH